MADFTVELSDNLLKIRAKGTWSFSDIVAVKEEYGPQVTRNLLWDLSATENLKISSNEIQRLPSIVKKIMINREPGGRTAIVCASDCNIGLINMYATYAEIAKLPYAVRPFREIEHAYEWLNEIG